MAQINSSNGCPDFNEHIVHLKYTSILSDKNTIPFLWQGNNYELHFEQTSPNPSCELKVLRQQYDAVDVNLLSWLSLYFGEDVLNPYQRPDKRFVFSRGDLVFKKDTFKKFINVAQTLPHKSYPKWRQEILKRALSYYLMAIRAGVNFMPVNLGLFALSIECLSNVYYGKRDKYFNLGTSKYGDLIAKKFERYKKNSKYKESFRNFEKKLTKDLELLKLFRNYYYGHSLTHQEKERKSLMIALRLWYERNGHDKKFSKLSFDDKRLNHDIAREAHALYKVGLRLNRLIFFYYLGLIRNLPFGDYDFITIGKPSRMSNVIEFPK